jgi:hypothetical protein
MKLNLQLDQSLSTMTAGRRTVYLFKNNCYVIADTTDGSVIVKYNTGDQIIYHLVNMSVHNWITEGDFTLSQIITDDGHTFNY